MPPKLAFEERSARRVPRPAAPRRSSASSSKAIWLVGWKPGFRKIGATRALQQVAGFSLSQAKEIVDRVLGGEKVRVGLLDNISLEPTIADLKEIGFEVRLREGTGGMAAYHVVPREDGWAVAAEGSQRATAVLETKAEAVSFARRLVRSATSGQLVIHGRDGRILQKHKYGK